MPRVALAAAAGVLLLTSCVGTSALEQCVEHSVEEGIDRERAEVACEDAVGED